MKILRVTTSPGDVADRISILKIKLKFIEDKKKLAAIKKELDFLEKDFLKFVEKTCLEKESLAKLKKFEESLLRLNTKGWKEIERHWQCISNHDMHGLGVATLSMIKLNSRRVKMKNKVTDLFSYPFTEIKTY